MTDLVSALKDCLKATFPPVTIRLLHEASREEPDFARIAEVISMDPALTATVLALANSPYYGLSQKADTIHRAAVTLGTRELLNMALSISLIGALKEKSVDKEKAYANWRLLVFGAVAARTLAEHMCPQDADTVFLTAMLKDISLVLASIAPEEGAPLIREDVIQGHQPLLCTAPGVEDESMPDHGKVSLALLRSFGVTLPQEAILHHHDLDHMTGLPLMAQAVILGQSWAENALGCTKDPAKTMQFRLSLEARLGMCSGDVEKLGDLCRERFKTMLSTLNIEESAPLEHYYQYSLPDMQLAYLLAMEVLHVREGAADVARVICRQLRLHYGVARVDVALKDPASSSYLLFSCDREAPVKQVDRAADFGLLNWSLDERGIPLFQGGRYNGELRVDLTGLPPDTMSSVMLYARHLSMSYDFYLERVAAVEMKAHTLDTLPIGVARCDHAGVIMEANEAFTSMLLMDEVRGRPALDVLTRALSITFEPEWAVFFRNDADETEGTISKIYCDLLLADSRATPCVYLSATRGQIGDTQEIILFIQDVTSVTDLEVQALRQLDFMTQLMASMQELVITMQSDGTVVYVSPSAPEELLGKNIFKIARPVDESRGPWGPDALSGDMAPVEVVLRLSSGALKPYELIISPLKETGGPKRYLIVGRDLTTIRRLEESLRRQAIYDGLTGLYNHEHLSSLLDRECRRAQRTGRPLSVLFMDLDGFKTINDTLGHQAGDNILKTVGRILIDTTRRGSDYPCRYGGDEFTVILAETDAQQATVAGNRIVKAMHETFGGRPGVSIGIATLRPEERPVDLLGRADQACYDAKSKGKNQMVNAD